MRKLIFMTGVAGLLLLTASQALTGPRELSVHGSELGWAATIHGLWIGGTPAEVQLVASRASDRRAGQVLDRLAAMTLGHDVLLLHLDVEGVRTETLSTLRVKVLPGAALENSVARAVLWNLTREKIAAEQSAGADTKILDRRDGTVDGRRGYEATFVTRMPDGAEVYNTLRLVQVDEDTTHAFRLEADGSKFRARYQEYVQFLETLRYGRTGRSAGSWR